MRAKSQEWFEVFYQDKFFRIEGEILHDAIEDNYIASIELIPDDCDGGVELFNKPYQDLQYAIKAIKKNYKATVIKLYRRLP